LFQDTSKLTTSRLSPKKKRNEKMKYFHIIFVLFGQHGQAGSVLQTPIK